VVEAAMGKHLRKGAHVHHVNGDRTDNRNQNLVVCHDAAYHMLLHKRARARDASGNPNAVRCNVCKGYEQTTDQMVPRGTPGAGFAHRECSARYSRDQYWAKKQLVTE
jgi:hypothetical protein